MKANPEKTMPHHGVFQVPLMFAFQRWSRTE